MQVEDRCYVLLMCDLFHHKVLAPSASFRQMFSTHWTTYCWCIH